MKIQIRYGWLIAALSANAAGQYLFNPKNDFQASTPPQTLPLDLSLLYDNRGFGLTPDQSDFDGYGNAFPAQYMPPSSFQYNGVNFDFPTFNATGYDNLISTGQTIYPPQLQYSSVYMLASSQSGMAEGTLNATYADGSSTSGAVLVPSWWSWPYPAGGDIIFPYYLTNETINYNRSNIFLTVNWLDSTKVLTSLTLPNVSAGAATSPGGAAVGTQLHIFSLSMLPITAAESNTPQLEVQYARSTRKFLGNNETQVIEATVANVGDEFVLRNNSVTVTVDSPGLTTVQNATINRLSPGDQVIVEIGVQVATGTTVGEAGNATVIIDGLGLSAAEYTFNATYGIPEYEATYESIYEHEAPDWYNGAKYGIFIHWGVYAVPAWGNTGKNEGYAEWYWWDLNQGPNFPTQTYEYHLEHYGPNVTYDDFIQNFTASAFNPQEWVDLFADAGAQYFVQVSKHHDGYAIFDLPSNVTQRTSVAQFPHRNLLQEIFDAAAQYQPQLHRATYYSLPEWFSPAYAPYGFASWPGGNATNPFTNETEPYTGFVPVENYVEDVILPEMQTLANMGTEIMWCDIGGPNLTAQFASEWFNTVGAQGRQVVIDSRCGLPGDFDTPEYARYSAIQRRKWESNLGMDPFSYGYNAATPDDQYMNASTIVTSLIDIVSKNGNFLLDVGPTANGTIIAVEQQHLREAGVWIKSHAEAIFNTTYWFVTPEEGDNIRFTQTLDAFYIHCLAQPNGTIVLESPVPYVQGDQITVVGGNYNGSVVPSQKSTNGSLVITVSDDVAAADEWTWVFKITY